MSSPDPVFRRAAGCIALAAALALAAGGAQAQRLLNLDFEEPSILDQARPAAWLVAQAGDQVALDSAVFRSGRSSLRTHPTQQVPAIASQSFPLALARGKKLRVSGWIRGQDVGSGWAGLWMRVDGPDGRPLAFDNMSGRGVTGTADWARFEVELPVDTTAVGVSLGVLHSGAGTAWFDGLQVAVDGVPYDPAGAVWTPGDAERAWARSRAVRFGTTDPAAPLDDLRAVLTLVGDAHVVALGEGTHGTREFFQMKHRLTRALAEQRGFTVFAIEASMPEARIVNEYVLTGRGDPRQAIAGMYFWTWNTEEVLALVEWMRQYNASGRGRMEFWGFDMQFPLVAMDSVRAFARRADPAWAPELEAVYDSIAAALRDPARRNQAATTALWRAGTERVLRRMEESRGRYLQGRDSLEVAWAVQYARIAAQGARPAKRDSAMAENVRWMLDHQPRGTKAVLWAHNYHVSRQPGAMGAYLSPWLGNGMRVFGFAFHEGSYTARGPRGLAAYPALPSPPGTIEHLLHGLGIPRFVLDLRVTSPPPHGAAWVRRPHELRSIGSGALDWAFYPAPVGDWYDALIFIDKTTPAVQLPTARPDPYGGPPVTR